MSSEARGGGLAEGRGHVAAPHLVRRRHSGIAKHAAIVIKVRLEFISQFFRFVAGRSEIALLERLYDSCRHHDEPVQAVPLNENTGEASARIVQNGAINLIRKLLQRYRCHRSLRKNGIGPLIQINSSVDCTCKVLVWFHVPRHDPHWATRRRAFVRGRAKLWMSEMRNARGAVEDC